jgi:beta-lactamase regulating signal transducer with metallopeptidase domain
MRRSSAAIRHLVWSVALLGLLVLPILRAVIPELELPIPWSSDRALRAVDPQAGSAMIVEDASVVSDEALAQTMESGLRLAGERTPSTGSLKSSSEISGGEATVVETVLGAVVVSEGAAFERDFRPRNGVSASFWVVVLWAGVAVILLAPLLSGWIGVRLLATRSIELDDESVRAVVSELARRVGLARAPHLLVGPAGTMPMTWGIMRPVIVLPAEALAWPAARLEAVLLHELAHVARRDCLTQLVAGLARAVHWFNPLVWVAARQMRVERELACDDVALQSGARASDYAQELLGLARVHRAPVWTAMAAVAMARPNQLAHRLRAVLDEGRSRSRAGWREVFGTTAVAAVLILPLAAMVPAQVPVAPPPQAPRPLLSTPAVPPPTMETVARVASPWVTIPPAPSVSTAPPVSLQITPPQTAAITPLPLVANTPPVWNNPRAWNTPQQPSPGYTVAPETVSQDVTCAAAQSGWRTMNHSSNEDRSTIRMSRPGCDLDVRLQGDIDFDAEAIGIARMSRDALIRIEENDGRRERWLEIVAGTDGAPSFEYRENGRDATFDGTAREWYRAVMLVLFRRVGFAAEERVAALLRRGGAQAVLDELDNLGSDYVTSRYITELVEQAELNEAQFVTVVSVAMRRVRSDHYMAEILKTVAAEQPLTPRLLDDFTTASRQIESDHYRTEVLRSVIASGRLSTQQVASVIESAGDMESDHYRAELLTSIADRYALEPSFRPAYLRAVEGMESDHYRTETLKRLFQRDDLSPEEKSAVLQATRMIGSDHYRSELLKLVGSDGLQNAAMRQAFFESAAGIPSDHYYLEAMRVLVDDSQLSAALLTAVLDASARELDSDHYLSELLLRVLERHAVTGEVRTSFLRAMDSLSSDHYRGRVADVLLRAERR